MRIVYDGVSHAGKTTNLKQLSALFGTQRGSDLQSPGEVDGRTTYFDWVQLVAGAVCGFALTCEILTVPGQVVLTPRRRHLLKSADVVVYVCDSATAQLERCKEGLRVLREVSRSRARGLPFIVQANKQDNVDALAGPALSMALGLGAEQVVESIATEGIGVVDTFVWAVRTVSREIQSQTEAHDLRIDVRRAPTAHHVFEGVAAERMDPEWAAELLLEQTLAQMRIEQDLTVAPSRGVSELARKNGSRTLHAPPRLPAGDVPTGFIWPAHTGRETLRRLMTRSDAGKPSNSKGLTELRLGGHVLRTCPEQRFEDKEQARQALVRAARERTQLENLLAPDTVLVVSEAADGATWIWTVMRALATIEDSLDQSNQRRALVRAYAEAVADAIAVTIKRGIRLNLGPRSFGLDAGAARYIGDLGSGPMAEPAEQVQLVVRQLEALGGDAAQFREDLDRRLAQRPPAERLGT